MKTGKTKKEIWFDFTVYHKTNGFRTDNTDTNSIYLDFKVTDLPPDLTFKGPIWYTMRYSSDDTLELTYEHKKSVWEIFYEHATFNEILKSQEVPYCVTAPDLPKHTLSERFTFAEFKASHHQYCKRMLQVIGNYPEVLSHDGKASDALLYFLKIARYSIDIKKAHEARNIIKDYLLPDFRKHRRFALPSNEIFKLMRRLLIKLATHLAGKCKNALMEYTNYKRLTNSEIRELWRDHHSHILTWSQKNDGRIYEIANGSERSIKSLILSPSSFVDNALQTYYRISLRTLKSIK